MQKSQTLKPGALLRNGTYRIERVLGQGGFGITYLATDLNLDRKVAVKEFFPKDYCDRNSDTSHVTLGTQSTGEFVDKLKAKILKEARNIAKFDNTGIIKIHAAFEENNTDNKDFRILKQSSYFFELKDGSHQEGVAFRNTMCSIRPVSF